MKDMFKALACGFLIAGLVLGAATSRAEDTIKIGFIAPFSGAFAANGDAWLKMLTYAMNKTNERGGALGKKFELVTFDDKLQPAEALIALKSVTDQNLPFVMAQVVKSPGGKNTFEMRVVKPGPEIYPPPSPDCKAH